VRLDLDFGEAETIALALELEAGLVLLDEQAGRYAAQHFNLRVMGTVGLLVRAKNLGLIDEVRSHLDALRQQAGFYLSEAVYQHALSLTGE
jgi:predicted nucleic acid-binding protein